MPPLIRGLILFLTLGAAVAHADNFQPNGFGDSVRVADQFAAPYISMFPLQVNGGVLKTARGAPFLVVGDSLQDPITIPVCSAGNTVALCMPGGVPTADTIVGGQHTMVAYLKDRAAQGINALWFFAICEVYTNCPAIGNAQESTSDVPFGGQITGTSIPYINTSGTQTTKNCPEGTLTDNACYDLSTAGSGAGPAAYWAHIDAIVAIANYYHINLFFDVLPTDNCEGDPQYWGNSTSSWMYDFNNNYHVTGNYNNITAFASFLTNRYGWPNGSNAATNIVWALGNDWFCFRGDTTSANAAQVGYQFAATLKSNDPNHIIASEINTGYTSLDQANTSVGDPNASDNWAGIYALNGLYQYGTVYDQALRAVSQSAAAPPIMMETNYEGEDLDNKPGTGNCSEANITTVPSPCSLRARHQQWWTVLAGGTPGFISSNHYTWQLCTTAQSFPCTSNWYTTGTLGAGNCGTNGSTSGTTGPINIDTPSFCQLYLMYTILSSHNWWKLVPDITYNASGLGTTCGSFVTAGCGTYTSNGSPGGTTGNNVTDTRVIAAVASDKTFAAAYLPENNGNVTFAFSQLNASPGAHVTAQWIDPTTGVVTSTACSPGGTQCTASDTLTPPSGTHTLDGYNDWVLLATAQ